MLVMYLRIISDLDKLFKKSINLVWSYFVQHTATHTDNTAAPNRVVGRLFNLKDFLRFLHWP